MMRISVVVVAPARQRAICRSALAASARIAIAGEGRRVTEGLELVRRHLPTVVILGNTGRMAPALAVTALRRCSPGTRVILLTTGMAREAAALEAAKRGAQGCLDEPAASAFLLKAVCAVAQGEAWVPRGITTEIVRRLIDRERAAAPASAR